MSNKDCKRFLCGLPTSFLQKLAYTTSCLDVDASF